MKSENGKVIFENGDFPMLQKNGPIWSAFAFSRHNESTPFIGDSYQLAALLHTTNDSLFRILRKPDVFYDEYSVPKKNGRGRRFIDAPTDKLKEIQRRILDEILVKIPISKYARAYYKGATLLGNAAPHIGKKHLLKLDLCDFFRSIHFSQIYVHVFTANRFPKQVRRILTGLCCKRQFLAQGAPTSPSVSNIVMKDFDDTFGAWCEKRGFSYTRYCDDLTVSGDSSLYPAYIKAKGMLEAMGFTVNEKKTHFLTNANRQMVTGLTVNEKISVPADYKRRLRQEVYYACKFGLEDIITARYPPDEFIEYNGELLPYRPQLTPRVLHWEIKQYRNELLGKIDYVLSIEPANRYFREVKEKLQSKPVPKEYQDAFNITHRDKKGPAAGRKTPYTASRFNRIDDFDVNYSGVLERYLGTKKEVVIPREAAFIGRKSFFEEKQLVSVTMPYNVLIIGDEAFSGCCDLEAVTFQKESLIIICNHAFCHCSRLKYLKLPDTLKKIGNGAFLGCKSLINITIPKSVSEIGKDAFCDCPNLTLRIVSGSYAEKYAVKYSVQYEI